MTKAEFRTRAIRAALAVMADGIVFEEECRDSFDKTFENLDLRTQNRWFELADLLTAVLVPIIQQSPNSVLPPLTPRT